MASVHHLKIENSGKKGQIGNIDIRLSLDKDDDNSNSGAPDVSRLNRTRGNFNPQRQVTFPGYERERSRHLPSQDESESECETDIDNLYADNEPSFNGQRALKLDDVNMIHSILPNCIRKARDKHKQSRSNKRDGYKLNKQKEIPNYFKKKNITKAVKEILKESTDFFAYVFGSYFDKGQSDPLRLFQDELSSERNRFRSFHGYNGSGNPWSLSRDGFYHDQTEGQSATRCFECGVRHSAWTQADEVSSVHRRLSPNCTFLNRNTSLDHQTDVRETVTRSTNTTGRREHERVSTASGVSGAQRCVNLAGSNVPREAENQERQMEAASVLGGSQSSTNFDQSHFGSQFNQGSCQMHITQETGYNTSSEQSTTNGLCTGASQMYSPNDASDCKPVSNPGYSSIEARICSFARWTVVCKDPLNLAEAGFYFTGQGDTVRCFCCGIGLRAWSADDDPWEEHARWYPSCEYIKREKGERYIALVRKLHSEDMGIQEEQQNETADMMNDPDIIKVAAAMQAMGISPDGAMEAVLAFRQQTGLHDVNVEQAINWYFDRQQTVEVPLQSGANADPKPSMSSTTSSTVSSSDNTEASDVREENRRLKDSMMCKICMEQPMSITFLPCGHLMCCETCAQQKQQCPTCRVWIAGNVKTFMA